MSLNILLVDDSSTVRAIISKALHLSKVAINELHQASNGKEALEILGDQWIDLVIADINMPVMNGIEMIEKMIEDKVMKTIPVVVVSTEGSETRIEQLKKQGVLAYIRKPFTPEMIGQIVDGIAGAQNAE